MRRGHRAERKEHNTQRCWGIRAWHTLDNEYFKNLTIWNDKLRPIHGGSWIVAKDSFRFSCTEERLRYV